jgi:hypothetical protein
MASTTIFGAAAFAAPAQKKKNGAARLAKSTQNTISTNALKRRIA